MKKITNFILFFKVLVLICGPLVLTAESLSCTFGNYDHNYIKIQEFVNDDENSTTIPKKNKLYANSVQGMDIMNNSYVIINKNHYEGSFTFIFSQINEKFEPSQSNFCYNFTVRLNCTNRDIVDLYVKVPLIDTNNHEPFFEKPKYTYNLISSYAEDFKRQQFLNPVIATDYDVTNTAVKFSNEENEYFNIMYNGIVPNSLNKKHYALLTPKIPGKLVTRKIEVNITVTDVGFPPRSNVTKLVINPPSPPGPVFSSPFYVGHSYKNRTFVMFENPKLEEGCTFYETRIDVLTTGNKSRVFYAEIINDKILIKKFKTNLSYFFEKNYSIYQLKAFYIDRVTKLYSSGTATLIVEDHHDL
ncbi:uncharacterized protein LOC123013123 [Tribolium madens]|uniref:uncharacterized protein LOC123013123 n=1 Tax=Tribolium madens TaxID=41895 RepID=UPI001CF76111|nr:uncharacterized protein LOC123013123 [Tribolium madens]